MKQPFTSMNGRLPTEPDSYRSACELGRGDNRSRPATTPSDPNVHVEPLRQPLPSLGANRSANAVAAA